MTVTDQIKTLNRKIKQNESQYDLDRKAAEISALSSKNLDMNIWLVKIWVLSQVLWKKLNLNILHWVKFLIKDWAKMIKKKDFWKKLKNIEDKNEEQLQVIKDQGGKQLEQLKNIDKSKTLEVIGKISKINDEANKLLLEFKKIDKTLENADLVCAKTDKTKYDFSRFSLPLKFIEKNYEITLDEAINDQTKLSISINKLNNNYGPRNTEKIEEKRRILKSARKLQNARKDIIDSFEKGIFPYRGNIFTTKEELEENKCFKYIENESKGINYDLFKNYFDLVAPSALAKKLFKTKDKKKNNDSVTSIKNRWSNLKYEIEKNVWRWKKQWTTR